MIAITHGLAQALDLDQAIACRPPTPATSVAVITDEAWTLHPPTVLQRG